MDKHRGLSRNDRQSTIRGPTRVLAGRLNIKNSSHGKRAHPVVVINETADGSFSLASSPCAQTLEPGQQCTVSLTFPPAIASPVRPSGKVGDWRASRSGTSDSKVLSAEDQDLPPNSGD